MYHETIFETTKALHAGIASGPVDCARDLMQCDPVFLRTDSTHQQAMEAFRKTKMSSLLVAGQTPLNESLSLTGRVCLKDVFRQIFPCLMQKDLIGLNQILHKPIEHILLFSQKTVNSESNIKDILAVMLADFPTVTGVVHNGTLVGQICCADLLNLFKPIDGKDGPWIEFIQQAFSESSMVKTAMASHILCLSSKDEISKVMGVFMATETPVIPILDEQGRLKRIISRLEVLDYILDVLEAKELTVFEKKGLILDRTIGSLLEKEFFTVSASAGLVDAINIMIEKNIFCLAVTDTHHRFCGLLTFRDVLNWVHIRLKKQIH